MIEVIVFADPVGLVIGRLQDLLDARGQACMVTDRVPAGVSRFIVVTLADTEPVRNYVLQTFVLRFDVHDTVKEDASDLGQLAAALMRAMQGEVLDGTTIYKVADAAAPGGMHDRPDPLTNEPGFTFHSAMSCRGNAEEGS